MVSGVVRQNRGFITVASAVGQGTTFEIFLPRYLGTAQPLQSARPASAAQRGRGTILVVEDEPGILTLVTRMLVSQGYVVLGTSRPDEAIRVAQAHDGPIHLLLTDVIMPGMNGQDLADALMGSFPGIKCLFMSGYAADVITRQGVNGDARGFLQKPFVMSELGTAVRAVLGRG